MAQGTAFKARQTAKPQQKSAAPSPASNAQPLEEGAAYDRMDQTTPSVTAYWQNKQINFSWIDYGYYFLSMPRAVRIRFGEFELRCSLSENQKYPLADLLKDLRDRQVYGIFDMPKLGFTLRVFQFIKTAQGLVEEQL
jgi:hypothetical protein